MDMDVIGLDWFHSTRLDSGQHESLFINEPTFSHRLETNIHSMKHILSPHFINLIHVGAYIWYVCVVSLLGWFSADHRESWVRSPYPIQSNPIQPNPNLIHSSIDERIAKGEYQPRSSLIVMSAPASSSSPNLDEAETTKIDYKSLPPVNIASTNRSTANHKERYQKWYCSSYMYHLFLYLFVSSLKDRHWVSFLPIYREWCSVQWPTRH